MLEGKTRAHLNRCPCPRILCRDQHGVFVPSLPINEPRLCPLALTAPTVAPSGLSGGGGAPGELIVSWTVSCRDRQKRASGSLGSPSPAPPPQAPSPDFPWHLSGRQGGPRQGHCAVPTRGQTTSSPPLAPAAGTESWGCPSRWRVGGAKDGQGNAPAAPRPRPALAPQPMSREYQNGDGFGYLLSFRRQGGTSWQTARVPGADAQHFVYSNDSVRPYTPFEVKIRSYNRRGDGPESLTALVYSAEEGGPLWAPKRPTPLLIQGV